MANGTMWRNIVILVWMILHREVRSRHERIDHPSWHLGPGRSMIRGQRMVTVKQRQDIFRHMHWRTMRVTPAPGFLELLLHVLCLPARLLYDVLEDAQGLLLSFPSRQTLCGNSEETY